MNGKRQGKARVLLDSGSHGSFVTASIVSNLGLRRVRRELLGVSTLGRRAEEAKLTDIVEIELRPLGGGSGLKLEAFVVPTISSIRNQHVEIVKKDYAHLKNLWFSDVCKDSDELQLDILIGADYLWTFQKGRTVRGKVDEPVAVQTVLGYVLSGPMKVSADSDSTESSSYFVTREDRLDREVGRLWDLETLGIRESDDVQDRFVDSIEHNGDRYRVKLPWRQDMDNEMLPTNYELSLARMKGQLKRLSREPEVLREYNSIIKEQLHEGIISHFHTHAQNVRSRMKARPSFAGGPQNKKTWRSVLYWRAMYAKIWIRRPFQSQKFLKS